MRDEAVARNYAETLLALAEKHDAVEAWDDAFGGVARLLEENPTVRAFLETPRIEAAEKKQVLRKVLGDRLPRPLLNFLLVTIDKRRQGLLPAMARQYRDLVDEHMGRVHVDVTVARELDDATLQAVADRFSRVLGRTAIPHVRVDPDVLGGVVVRTGDTIYDGSLRRRLERMRRQLMTADLPESAEPGPDVAPAPAG